MKRFSLLFLIFTLLLLINPKLTLAKQYIVQPILAIPKDWNSRITSDRIENEFKPNILQAHKEVQKWYSDHLNGYTFNLADQVQVKKLQYEAGDLKYFRFDETVGGFTFKHTKDAYGLFLKLGGYDSFPPQEGAVYSIWIIGSEDLPVRNGWSGKGLYLGISDLGISDQFGYTTMNDQDIRNLYQGADPSKRRKTIAILAHELGHSFGLVLDGFAKYHPCTIVSLNECENGGLPICYQKWDQLNKEEQSKCWYDEVIKQVPPENEWNDNIMGYGGIDRYPSTGFTNTKYNPVLRKALLSPFLNPNKDPGPTPNNEPPKKSDFQITGVSKSEVASGETMEIYGSGFGTESGKVEIYSPFLNSGFTNFTIISWEDNKIVLKIGDNNFPADRLFKIYIQRLGDPVKKAYEKGELRIKGKQQIYHTSTYNILATCGQENTPIPSITAKFYQLGFPNSAGFITTDTEGRGTLKKEYPIKELASVTYTIEMPVRKSFGVPEPTKYDFIPSDFNKYDNSTFTFHYPQCPEGVATPTPSPTENTLPAGNTESNQDNTPSQIIISNSEDFTKRENASGEETTNVEVVENPDKEKEITYQPPKKGNDDFTYIRVIEKDGDVKDYQTDLENGETTEVAGVKIVAKITKKVKEIDMVEVGNESNKAILYTDEAGYQNPEIDLNNDLNLFKIITIYNDETSEEDSSFYVEKFKQSLEQPSQTNPSEHCDNIGDYDRVCIGEEGSGTYKFRQCQDNNTWSDWLGSENNPDNFCRTE